MFAWNSPQSIDAGPHNIQVRFNGGRDWVDPSAKVTVQTPTSTIQAGFSKLTVAVPTKILSDSRWTS